MERRVTRKKDLFGGKVFAGAEVWCAWMEGSLKDLHGSEGGVVDCFAWKGMEGRFCEGP
jgi:hypothetical protein